MKLKEIYKPEKNLVGFPNEILIAINKECIKQGNYNGLPIIDKKNIYAGLKEGGFDWRNTKNRSLFWSNVITDKNFNLFINQYIK